MLVVSEETYSLEIHILVKKSVYFSESFSASLEDVNELNGCKICFWSSFSVFQWILLGLVHYI